MSDTTKPVNPVAQVTSGWFTNAGKSVEKLALYTVGTLTATGVINPAHLQAWILASVGAILTGLHISTPTPKSGPGQL